MLSMESTVSMETTRDNQGLALECATLDKLRDSDSHLHEVGLRSCLALCPAAPCAGMEAALAPSARSLHSGQDNCTRLTETMERRW